MHEKTKLMHLSFFFSFRKVQVSLTDKYSRLDLLKLVRKNT